MVPGHFLNRNTMIEDILYPNHSRLVKIQDIYATQIIDVELDPIDCQFHNDNCVDINTSKYSYITLKKETLYKLIDLIEEAERRYEEE